MYADIQRCEQYVGKYSAFLVALDGMIIVKVEIVVVFRVRFGTFPRNVVCCHPRLFNASPMSGGRFTVFLLHLESYKKWFGIPWLLEKINGYSLLGHKNTICL
jgi:hypothetical protein